MRHPWRLTVPGRATRHPPAWFPVWRLGGQGNLSVPGHAGSAPLDRRPAWVDPRHAWMLQVPGPAPATHGVALPPFRRVGSDGSACPAPKARPTWVRAGLLRGFPRWLFGLGCSPAHQPSVYGMAWVGWRDRKAPWMAHYEPPWVRTHCLRGTASHAFERTAASGWAGPRSGVHGGSRDPTHAVPPRVTRKCGFGFGFGFRFGPSSSCHTLHPPAAR